ncbi:MAG: DnaJ domain-containing protein [Mycoplasmoidaceae bacterium]
MKDYYQILGVEYNATQEEIKKAYKKLAKEFHPDVNKSMDAEDRFKEISKAYETLSDNDQKEKYDYDFFNKKSQKNEYVNPYISVCKFCGKETAFDYSTSQIILFCFLLFLFFPLGILYALFASKRTCIFCKCQN